MFIKRETRVWRRLCCPALLRSARGESSTCRYALSCLFTWAALVVFLIAIFTTASFAQGTVVGSSPSTDPELFGGSRSFFDEGSSRHWIVWHNGTDIVFSSSTDGSSWQTRGTRSVRSPRFSVAYARISSTSYAYLAVENTSGGIDLHRATLQGDAISFESSVVAYTPTLAKQSFIKPFVTIDTSKRGWISAITLEPSASGEAYQSVVTNTLGDGTLRLSFRP